jgi:hypothetical protein
MLPGRERRYVRKEPAVMKSLPSIAFLVLNTIRLDSRGMQAKKTDCITLLSLSKKMSAGDDVRFGIGSDLIK